MVRVGTSYDEHIHAVGGDKVDIAFMGPASYVLMTEQYGFKPLLARLVVQGQSTFAGVLFARADSSVATLKDLAGKRFAFGASNSTMSHLVPRYMLQQADIPLSRLAGHSFLHSHENVVLGVLAGDYDAGAVKEEVFLAHKNQGLKEIARTPEISEHLFVSSSTLAAPLAQAIKEAFLSLHTFPDGLAALQEIKNGTTALGEVTDNDYESLRRILRSLQQQGVLRQP